MTRIIALLILLCTCGPAVLSAQQDFKLAANGKTIAFVEIDRLNIVGVDGTNLLISGAEQTGKTDSRAVGLRKISASGLTDNTGFGLSVKESGGVIRIEQVGGKIGEVTVKVPNGASVTVEQSTHRGGGLEVSDFSGSLDVTMMYHKVRLKNVTGPLAVNTVYDDIIATFSKQPTEEIRLHSSYSDVDLSLPASTKANLRLSTGYGNMYTDFDIAVSANMPTTKGEKKADEEDCNCDPDHRGDNMTGTINGGGKLISLTATYDNIYLRKN